MAIKLTKGQTISLDNSQYDLSSVTIGLGWDVRQPPQKGLLGSLFGGAQSGPEYDLDAIAFLLDEDGKVRNVGEKLVGGDVIFFNSLKHPSGTIWLTGDNRTGAGEGDDEQIVVRLTSLPATYHRILFLVCIYQGAKNGQHFGMVDNAFIRAVDARGTEIARYSLSTEQSFNDKRSLIFAEAYRKDGGWKFRALGEPRPTDSFVEILQDYVAR